jgi:hypothetical protein
MKKGKNCFLASKLIQIAVVFKDYGHIKDEIYFKPTYGETLLLNG